MIIDIKTKAVCQVDIDAGEAFRILCKTLDMDFVLDEDTNFLVMEDPYTKENAVYISRNGHEEIYDDRGNLFVDLRNLATDIFPDTAFRNADYIYNR